MPSKKALVVVSVGCSSTDVIKRNIMPIEKDLIDMFPERKFFRAFTSNIIRKQLFKKYRLKIDGVLEVLEFLKINGYDDVLIQPTHLINGIITEQFLSEIDVYKKQFQRIAIGRPLLNSIDDLQQFADNIIDELPAIEASESIVFVGHGADNSSDMTYPALEYVFRSCHYYNIHIGTVNGYPTFKNVLDRLTEDLNIKTVYLVPLFITVGTHTIRDVAGLWTAKLEEHNYKVIPIANGLGSYSGVRQMFVEHAWDALNDI